MADRFAEIQALHDPAAREDAYRALDESIHFGKAPPPTPEEITTILAGLTAPQSEPGRAFLWRILLGGPASEQARDFAVRWIAQPKLAHRGLAATYIKRHYADLMPRVLERFGSDQDPEVRFVLAQYVQSSRPDAALDAMIDCLAAADHELFDAITIELVESGKTSHLNRLRELDRRAGGDTGYGRVADALEARLTGKDVL